jgi:uncharacterized protein with HEPN domain
MARRSDKVYLGDILDSIARIHAYMQGVTYSQLADDQLLQDAVIHRLELIGEASRQISDTFRGAHPQVPWQRVIGMRNRIAHEYFGVDLDRVWDAVAIDIQELEKHVAGWFAEEPDDIQ